MITLFVDVGWNVHGALINIDADVVEMFVFFERELARIEAFRHRIAYLLRTCTRHRQRTLNQSVNHFICSKK